MSRKQSLVETILRLKNSPVRKLVRKRMKQLENNENWFSELCFCISTANASSEAGLRFQSKATGTLRKASGKELRKWLSESGCRFYRNKARFMMEAREKFDSRKLKKTIKGFENEFQAREWIVENVKGLGWKEASHFLRNVGFKNLAILDRHVLNVLKENGLIQDARLSPKKYLEIEAKLQEICDEVELTQAELDFYLWFLKTGKVLK